MRILALTLATAIAAAPAHAQDESGGDSVFKRFEVGLGLGGGGPLMFRDTPDETLEAPTVFQYGTRLAFRFGDPKADPHRFGIAVGYHSLARSGSRKLGAVDPALVYATGGATEVQFGLGYRVGLGSDGFTIADGAVPYSGPLTSLELRHSFLDGDADVPMGGVAGVFAESTIGRPASFSTAFVGARLDLTFRKN